MKKEDDTMSERILVCGSREWPGTWEDIGAHFPESGDVTIIHGACSRIVRRAYLDGRTWPVEVSVDMLADFAARGLGFNVETFPADWSLGKKAGPMRNARMLRESKPDRGLAFGALWKPYSSVMRCKDCDLRVDAVISHINCGETTYPSQVYRPTGTGDMVAKLLAVGLPVRWIPAPSEPAQDLTSMPAPPAS